MADEKALQWLVVEDHRLLREMVEMGCQLMGHPCLSFADGRQAMAWMEGALPKGDIPDVALIDVGLPGQPDGHALAAHIRQHALLSNMVIILATGSLPPPSEREEPPTHPHADLVLFKPYPLVEELAGIAHELIAKRQEASKRE